MEFRYLLRFRLETKAKASKERRLSASFVLADLTVVFLGTNKENGGMWWGECAAGIIQPSLEGRKHVRLRNQ